MQRATPRHRREHQDDADDNARRVTGQLSTAQNVQNARVDALGHRMGEMNDMLMARELRVETQINDLSNQMHTVLNAINIMRREKSLPRQREKACKAEARPEPRNSRPQTER